MKDKIQTVLDQYTGTQAELIPILQHTQQELGYLPPEAMEQIGLFLKLTKSQVYGVASFYTQFRFSPIGNNHIMVCRGTACHVRGAPQILDELERHLGIKEGEVTDDLEYSLETVACIGSCALAPCLMVNKKVEASMTPKKVRKTFKQELREDPS
jgi:NADH-quinone oxidoreductase subunit E